MPNPNHDLHTGLKGPDRAWTVDRIGRLLSGSSILFYVGLWLVLPASQRWLPGLLLAMAGLQLVGTSLVGWCPLQYALRRIGAREREEVLLDQVLDGVKRDAIDSMPQRVTPPNEFDHVNADRY